MAISIRDIQEKEFSIQETGGYNVEQVDDFLDEIAEQFSALMRDNLSLNQRIAEMGAELDRQQKALEDARTQTPDYNEADYFENLQSAMRESLICAQRLADETTASAKAEAERILAAANADAQKTLNAAKEEAEHFSEDVVQKVAKAEKDLESLKKAAGEYHAAFTKLVQDQVAFLKQTESLLK